MTVDELKDLLGKVTPGPLVSDSFAVEGDHNTRIAFPDRYGVPSETVGEAFQNWNDAESSDQRISWKQAEANARLWSISPQIAAALIEAMEGLRWSHDTLDEINVSNYDHDDVCRLNDRSVEVILGIANILSRIDAILEGKG